MITVTKPQSSGQTLRSGTPYLKKNPYSMLKTATSPTRPARSWAFLNFYSEGVGGGGGKAK